MDSIFHLNSELILSELELCVNQASAMTKYLQESDCFWEKNKTVLANNPNCSDIYKKDFVVKNTLRELSFLTENSNYLHRPSLDNDFLKSMPHYLVSESSNTLNSDVDIMVGITSQESFYFLLHEYNLNHILSHAFIYSSILNLTDNLLFKLTKLNNDVKLSSCLKKNLFNFYNMDITDESILKKNSLKNNFKSLDLISDYDFILPLITQLKAYLNQKNTDKSNLYVYEFSHLPSFNYLLTHMKSYYKVYESALDYFNHSVVPHFSELDFVFGLPVLSKSNLVSAKDEERLYNYTRDEYDLSVLMIKYWSNFAKYGFLNI